MSNPQVSLDRYEMKYVIPYAMIDTLSSFIEPYCSLDRYSQIADNNFYRVNNLYFDTPYYLFLRNRLIGIGKRFNMRIRSYGNNAPLPYFLEIKHKNINLIKKSRGRVYDQDWSKMFYDPNYQSNLDSPKQDSLNVSLFQRLAFIYNAEPKVLTQYWRKAYVSNYEEYARVTFDIGLRYMQETEYNLVPQEEKMIAYDHTTNFDPGCDVILELKCYANHVPLWMVDLIKTFDLTRRSFSKYATGVIEVLNLYTESVFDREAKVRME